MIFSIIVNPSMVIGVLADVWVDVAIVVFDITAEVLTDVNTNILVAVVTAL